MISFSVRERIIQHVDYLKKHVEITDENDKENFENVYASFTRTATKLHVYQTIRIIVAALLYVSIIAALTQSVAPAFTWAVKPLVAISSLIGTAVLGAAYLALTSLNNLVLNDLLAEHTHLVALLVKNNDEFIAHPGYKYGILKHYD